jgi:transposase
MLQFAPGVKVYLACRPVDMRRGFDGLAADVAQTLRADPYLCVGRDYVAASSREALFRGSALSHRHIIICSRAVAAPCLLT